MNLLPAAKAALGFLASIGIGNIVGNVIQATTPANVNAFNRVTIRVGTFVLGGVIASYAVEEMNRQIDELAGVKKEPEASQK